MTNKLPQVGKRYRSILSPHITIVIEEIDKLNSNVFYNFENDSFNSYAKLNTFYQNFEELPEKSSTDLLKEQKSLIGRAKELIDEKENPISAKNSSQIELITLNEGLKWLKDQISFIKERSCGYESKFETILIALDSFFNMFSKTEITENQEWPTIDSLGNGDSISGKANNDVINDDFDEKKSSSIWKSVSERITFIKRMGHPDILIKFNDGNIKLGKRSALNTFHSIDESYKFKSEHVKEYCLLTDFINYTESLGSRIERLERK